MHICKKEIIFENVLGSETVTWGLKSGFKLCEIKLCGEISPWINLICVFVLMIEFAGHVSAI